MEQTYRIGEKVIVILPDYNPYIATLEAISDKLTDSQKAGRTLQISRGAKGYYPFNEAGDPQSDHLMIIRKYTIDNVEAVNQLWGNVIQPPLTPRQVAEELSNHLKIIVCLFSQESYGDARGRNLSKAYKRMTPINGGSPQLYDAATHCHAPKFLIPIDPITGEEITDELDYLDAIKKKDHKLQGE